MYSMQKISTWVFTFKKGDAEKAIPLDRCFKKCTMYLKLLIVCDIVKM